MNDHWGYNSHDSNWKTTQELIRTLVDVASKGGNLLLNIGPRPTARSRSRASSASKASAAG
jgi:alpha-L-fucosidase